MGFRVYCPRKGNAEIPGKRKDFIEHLHLASSFVMQPLRDWVVVEEGQSLYLLSNN